MPKYDPEHPLGMMITGSKPLYQIGRDYEVQITQKVWPDEVFRPDFDEVAASKSAIEQAVMLALSRNEYKDEAVRKDQRTRWVATRNSKIKEISFGEYETTYLVRRTL